MGSYVHKPVRWDKEAATAVAAGLSEPALAKSLATLEQVAESRRRRISSSRASICFQLDRFDEAVAILERAPALFPNHPMLLLSLGSAHNRARHHARGPPLARTLPRRSASPTPAPLTPSPRRMPTRYRQSDQGQALRDHGAATKRTRPSPIATAHRRSTSGESRARRSQIIAFTFFGSKSPLPARRARTMCWRRAISIRAGSAASMSTTASMRPSSTSSRPRAPKSSATTAAIATSATC